MADDKDVERLTPQSQYDQDEAVQVGGTVVNAPKNRDEYETKRTLAKKKAAKKA